MTEIADYETRDELGNGSHGTVYITDPPARLSLAGVDVAVKIFDRETDTAEYRRVVEEAKTYASAAKDCPELMPLYEVGREDRRLFQSLAYYPQGSLKDQARSLTKQQVVEIVADAAIGAHALHEVGLVHREIKPTNIFITDDHRGVLGDLGLAHVVSPGQTVTGLGVSSLATMEPGLVRGESSARASDIWSLGATLHWGLTGRNVFPDLPESSLISVLRHIMIAPPTISESGIPGPIRGVLEKCLAQDRMNRYGTAKELADELNKILEGIRA